MDLVWKDKQKLFFFDFVFLEVNTMNYFAFCHEQKIIERNAMDIAVLFVFLR